MEATGNCWSNPWTICCCVIDHFHKRRPLLQSLVFMLIRPTALILKQVFFWNFLVVARLERLISIKTEEHFKLAAINRAGSYLLLLSTIFHWLYSVALPIVFCAKSIVIFVRCIVLLVNPEASSVRYDKTPLIGGLFFGEFFQKGFKGFKFQPSSDAEKIFRTDHKARSWKLLERSTFSLHDARL